MIMFSLFGWTGQHGYNYLDKRNSQELRDQAALKASGEDRPKDNIMTRFAKSKWSPMSVLTDEQYEDLLQEKLLKVEAEIAIIDERIEGFKKETAKADLRRSIQDKQGREQE
jgi:hypothetical protein